MPEPAIYRATAFEDTGISLMARVAGTDAANIQQADVSSIAFRVIDLEDSSTVDSGSLTVASVVFDTLQTDARWTKDSTGYNFRWSVTAAQLPGGNKTYRCEALFTPASGEVYAVLFDVHTINLLGS